MLTLKIGAEIKLPDGGNVYKIVKISECKKFILIDCIWFSEIEDLGDLIFCESEGDEIWICSYHFNHMINID